MIDSSNLHERKNVLARDDANKLAILRVYYRKLPQLHVAKQVAHLAQPVCCVADLRLLDYVVCQVYKLAKIVRDYI